jgi:hypothetical protein
LRKGNFWRKFRGGTAGAQPIIARNSLFLKIIKSSILLEFENNEDSSRQMEGILSSAKVSVDNAKNGQMQRCKIEAALFSRFLKIIKLIRPN